MTNNLTKRGLPIYNSRILQSTVCATILTLNAIFSRMLHARIAMFTQSVNVYAATFLAATTYGIVNDIFVTGDSITYFARGHNPGAVFLNTYDRFANSFVCGHIAVSGLAELASFLFAISAFALNIFGYAQQPAFAPLVIGASVLVATAIDLCMRVAKWRATPCEIC